MKEKAIKAYCRQVRKVLFCAKTRKKALLDGLKLELEDKADHNATLQDLEEIHGTVIATTNNLHLEVPEEEQRRARRNIKIHRIIVNAVIASAVLAIIGTILYACPFYTIINLAG